MSMGMASASDTSMPCPIQPWSLKQYNTLPMWSVIGMFTHPINVGFLHELVGLLQDLRRHAVVPLQPLAVVYRRAVHMPDHTPRPRYQCLNMQQSNGTRCALTRLVRSTTISKLGTRHNGSATYDVHLDKVLVYNGAIINTLTRDQDRPTLAYFSRDRRCAREGEASSILSLSRMPQNNHSCTVS